MAKSTNVGAVDLELKLNSSNYDKQLDSKIKGTESVFSNTFSKIGGFIAGAFAVKQIINFTKTTIDSASKVQNAFTGLNSIVQGTGNSFSQAQDFIKKYTADGLVSIEETATAYKNLLSRGYDSSQIEDVLNRLKDSAAFGRQASYDLGEAVVTATEGLKNENSILVDNAGVTKNVAKMWEEYAASVGKSSTSLTQAEKIQAEYKGIMNETKFQVGDAANYTKTFSGQIQQLKFNFNQMTVAIGKVVTPISQLFIPAINSAINAVTKLFEKIQIIIGAFGLKMPTVVSKTSDSIDGIGESSKNAAKDAVNSAKKINKAFSNLDEIHVLKTKQSDDSDKGSGSTVSVSPVIEESSIDNSMGSIIKKINKYLEPLKNINFNPLIDSFIKLKDAISPITKTAFEGLEWVYFNLLVPLGKFTIENVIPTFLDLCAGALEVLNPLLTAFQSLGEWLWNSFLQPIASWTGGIVISVLNGIADSLDKIGTWMNDNQSIVNACTYAVVAFFGAWEIIKLMSFIEQAGGVVNVIKIMTSRIWENIAAKVADKAETVALTLMYAKDFLKSIVTGTAALVKQAAQWVITTGAKIADTAATVASTAATTAATAATWLFNAALAVLTSPITLVILAVAALVAGIVVLIKNWGKVKEAAGKCWDGIKSIWGSVSSWFDNKIIQPIKNLFGSLSKAMAEAFKMPINLIIDGINLFTSGLNKIKIPDWVPAVGGKGFNIGKIPRLAEGGYFRKNNPRLAIVGDNKREPEITTPESKIYDQVIKANRDSERVGKQEIEITIYHKYEDGRTIIQKINQAQIDAGQIMLLT